MYYYKTDAERWFAWTSRYSRSGNRSRKKVRSIAGDRRATECGFGCDRHDGVFVFDERSRMLDEIHKYEIEHWEEEVNDGQENAGGPESSETAEETGRDWVQVCDPGLSREGCDLGVRSDENSSREQFVLTA